MILACVSKVNQLTNACVGESQATDNCTKAAKITAFVISVLVLTLAVIALCTSLSTGSPATGLVHFAQVGVAGSSCILAISFGLSVFFGYKLIRPYFKSSDQGAPPVKKESATGTPGQPPSQPTSKDSQYIKENDPIRSSPTGESSNPLSVPISFKIPTPLLSQSPSSSPRKEETPFTEPLSSDEPAPITTPSTPSISEESPQPTKVIEDYQPNAAVVPSSDGTTPPPLPRKIPTGQHTDEQDSYKASEGVEDDVLGSFIEVKTSESNLQKD